MTQVFMYLWSTPPQIAWPDPPCHLPPMLGHSRNFFQSHGVPAGTWNVQKHKRCLLGPPRRPHPPSKTPEMSLESMDLRALGILICHSPNSLWAPLQGMMIEVASFVIGDNLGDPHPSQIWDLSEGTGRFVSKSTKPQIRDC